MLYKDKGGSFADLIDKGYRKRALSTHLKLMPIFKGLPDEILADLSTKAELVEFDEGITIIPPGTSPDAVYLIRSGVARQDSNLTAL